MKLTEIFLDTDKTKSSWWDSFTDRYFSTPIKLGEKDGVEFYFDWDENVNLNISLVAVLKAKHKKIAEVMLNKLNSKVYSVESLSMNTTYSGFDVPYMLYKFFVLAGYTLISGPAQTFGSQKIWQKLIATPSLRIYLYPRYPLTARALDFSKAREVTNADEEDIWSNEEDENRSVLVATKR